MVTLPPETQEALGVIRRCVEAVPPSPLATSLKDFPGSVVVPMESATSKFCWRCQQDLPRKDFYPSKAAKSGLTSWCRACWSTYSKGVARESYTTLKGQLRARARAARVRAVRFGLPFDIDADYLLMLWEEQDERCAVSGLPFVLSDGTHGKQPFRPSVDRVDPVKGYVHGNVRLVATIVNFGMNKWSFENFLTMCRAVVSKAER
jgi:hypothetical protein